MAAINSSWYRAVDDYLEDTARFRFVREDTNRDCFIAEDFDGQLWEALAVNVAAGRPRWTSVAPLGGICLSCGERHGGVTWDDKGRCEKSNSDYNRKLHDLFFERKN